MSSALLNSLDNVKRSLKYLHRAVPLTQQSSSVLACIDHLSTNLQYLEQEINIMTSKHDRFTITGVFIRESDSGKAFLFHLDDDTGEASKLKKWIPHSQSKMLGTEARVTDHAGCMSITIPLWMAEKEGIYDLYKESIKDKECQTEMEYEEEDIDDDIPF